MSDILKQMGQRAFGGQGKGKRPPSPTDASAPKRPATPANGLFQGQQPATTSDATPAPQVRIPAIFLDAPVENWPDHAKKMIDVTGGDFSAVFRGKTYRLRTKTVEGFRRLQRYLFQAKLSFYTFSFRGHRGLKVVISGLPETTEEELHDALTEKKFAVSDLARLRNHRGPTRSWLVTLLPDKEREDPETLRAQDIYLMASLMFVRVKVSPYKKPRGPPQCHRCQGFGHGSSNCGRPRRCVRCGGPHTRMACKLAADQKGSCCNCGGDHNASYRGCKAFKEAAHPATAPALEKPAEVLKRPAPATTPAEPAPATQTTPDEEEDPTPEEGFTPAKRRKKRPARNPDNRRPRQQAEPARTEEVQRQPRATPRLRIDWPPKPVTEQAPAISRDQPAQTAETPAAPAASQPQDVAALLAAVLEQLTALTGLITELMRSGRLGQH